ncbi:hypothetical protein ABTX78_23475, partial [Streptomyces sp. NPDC096193]
TVVAVAAEKNSTLVLPFPVELLRFLERAQQPVPVAVAQAGAAAQPEPGRQSMAPPAPGAAVGGPAVETEPAQEPKPVPESLGVPEAGPEVVPESLGVPEAGREMVAESPGVPEAGPGGAPGPGGSPADPTAGDAAGREPVGGTR